MVQKFNKLILYLLFPISTTPPFWLAWANSTSTCSAPLPLSSPCYASVRIELNDLPVRIYGAQIESVRYQRVNYHKFEGTVK